MTPDCERRRLLRGAAAAGLGLSLGSAARAQSEFPKGTIRMIVPFPAGGSTDLLARLIGQGIAARNGQPVVIENRGGACGRSGTIGHAGPAPGAPSCGRASVSSVAAAP